MSKIPIDKNGKVRTSADIRGVYSTGHPKMKILQSINTSVQDTTILSNQDHYQIPENAALKKPACNKTFSSFIPKMSLNLDKVVEQNPRILYLREKLNEITKKQNLSVDKKTKGLINDITQQLVDEKDGDDSGPYSLLFDLQNDPSTSRIEIPEDSKHYRSERRSADGSSLITNNFNVSQDKTSERSPNVINFDEKPMREFEYSCESDINFPVKKTFGTHSRSDLCLQLKSNTHPRPFETNLSPNDNSTSRANEENSLDDSLGILTPDQMDDICYLDNTFSPTVEGLPIFCDNSENKGSPDNGDTPSTDKTESNSAASTIQKEGFDVGSKTSDVKYTVRNETPEIKDIDCANQKRDDNFVAVNSKESKSDTLISHNCKGNNSQGECFRKDETLPSLLEEEFMPSIHSSILEPISSVAEATDNLDIPLDPKHDIRLVVNRIEQTPSPEELPLDNSEIHGEISTYSQFSSSTLHDTQTYSDSKHDFPKSMETSKVSNSFITSITSITSLDGYQGDGEMSRPVSRGADHSIGLREDAIEMDWQNVPVTRRADPMTDSDFFTESDADGLDDNVQRGDRKAQVIDGALYGGKNGNGNAPLIVNRNDDSCMDSSGVYTDFENHRSSPVFLNVIDDESPEGTTPSVRSECSQKNGSAEKLEAYFTPLVNATTEQKTEIPEMIESDVTPKNSSKRNSVNSEKDLKSTEKTKDEKRSFTLKKYKMPKRDVPSKLKSMLASRKTDADSSVQSSPKIVKKTERRENFIKKNSLDLKTDYKTKSFKDIKSKVDSSFSLQRSQTACSVTRLLSSKTPSSNTKPKSRHMRMRIELSSAAGSGKSSLHSSQSDISAASAGHGKPAGRFPLIRNGKKRESAPAAAPARPPAPPTPSQPPPAKKNGVVPKLSSSPVSVRARTSLAPPPSPRKPAPNRVPVQRPTTLPTNKEPPRVSPAVGPRGKRVQTPSRAPPAPAPPATPRQTAALAHAAKGVEALGVLVQYLVFQLDALNGSTWKAEAERWRSMAATERSNAAAAQQRAQKDLDSIAECVSKISELEREVSDKEEANSRLQATHLEEVSALASDIKGLKGTIESLKHEVAESRARLHAHGELERTLRAQVATARAEAEAARPPLPHSPPSPPASPDCEKSCNMCDAACDPVCCEAEDCELRISINEELSSDPSELAAEVRSLRAVVEMKQAEVAALRAARADAAVERGRRAEAEREARAARHAAEELKERAAARQRDLDRLKDDNRRLREAAARDRDHASRLSALNEELRYKLRQRSQVMSILTGSGYMERSAMRTRTSSNDSGRSASPLPDSPPSPASPAPPNTDAPVPAVKGVVEKHDSVSWVLEIEETPEEVASRLARKSSFRAGAAASASGVKRRGGSSPGSSPAPASPAPNASKLFRPGELDYPPGPPPLKESAGEAIYIYDDRQY